MSKFNEAKQRLQELVAKSLEKNINFKALSSVAKFGKEHETTNFCLEIKKSHKKLAMWLLIFVVLAYGVHFYYDSLQTEVSFSFKTFSNKTCNKSKLNEYL